MKILFALKIVPAKSHTTQVLKTFTPINYIHYWKNLNTVGQQLFSMPLKACTKKYTFFIKSKNKISENVL